MLLENLDRIGKEEPLLVKLCVLSQKKVEKKEKLFQRLEMSGMVISNIDVGGAFSGMILM